jgi:uncharacterized protein YdhG (YjbR/CyaY superfamily)
VDEDIAAQREAVSGVLKRVRSTIRTVVRRAEEAIAYQILCQAVSVTLIAGIAKFLVKEAAAREKRKAGALKAR